MDGPDEPGSDVSQLEDSRTLGSMPTGFSVVADIMSMMQVMRRVQKT